MRSRDTITSVTKTARVALLQLPAFAIEDAEASLAHTLRRIDEAARERPDIIALPEVTYPAYFLGGDDVTTRGALTPDEAATRFSEKAREHGVYIAAGMALDAPGGGYTNGAALFGRDGEFVGRYDKAFLWHFDRRWFAPGDAYPVFETDAGRIGILICADGRLPEIARSLVLNGAQIILDLTAWVSGGRRVEQLTTVQREYMMPVRALENGVWIACADKFGVEAESIVYCGRSCVIDPRGRIVAELGTDEDAALVYDVPVEDAAPRLMRRPELYEALDAADGEPAGGAGDGRADGDAGGGASRRSGADDDAGDGHGVCRDSEAARGAAGAARCGAHRVSGDAGAAAPRVRPR